MALSQTSEDGRTYASIAGDNTVATYLATIPVDIFDGVKSLEIRSEAGPAIAVAVNKTMSALTDGQQLSPTDDSMRRSSRFEQVSLKKVHIYAADTASTIYIEARSF